MKSELRFYSSVSCCHINTLRPRQNGHHFPHDIYKCIFMNENKWISIKISLKFVPKDLINNIVSLVQIMAWRRPGDKPLSEPMMVSLLTHICVTRPQWVKGIATIVHREVLAYVGFCVQRFQLGQSKMVFVRIGLMLTIQREMEAMSKHTLA